MKEEQRNELKPLTPAVIARMEKSFFGSVILRERVLPSEVKEEKPYERDAKASSAV